MDFSSSSSLSDASNIIRTDPLPDRQTSSRPPRHSSHRVSSSTSSASSAAAALVEQISSLQSTQVASTQRLHALQISLADLQQRAELDISERHDRHLRMEMNLNNEKEALVDFASLVQSHDTEDNAITNEAEMDRKVPARGTDALKKAARLSTKVEAGRLISESLTTIKSHEYQLKRTIDADTEAELDYRIIIERQCVEMQSLQLEINERERKIVKLRRELSKVARFQKVLVERKRLKQENERREQKLLEDQMQHMGAVVLEQGDGGQRPPKLSQVRTNNTQQQQQRPDRLQERDERLHQSTTPVGRHADETPPTNPSNTPSNKLHIERQHRSSSSLPSLKALAQKSSSLDFDPNAVPDIVRFRNKRGNNRSNNRGAHGDSRGAAAAKPRSLAGRTA